MNFFKGNKYKAKKTEHLGYSHSSKLEAAVFGMLHAQKEAGMIASITVQPSVYMTRARILFKPDFKCTRTDGSYFYAEAKGFSTAIYQIKRRLWAFYGDGDLEVYKGHHSNPMLAEIIKVKE